ncbi:hypothetical protein FB451DRAFT_1489816 [Mycena latifolia]|nr:hypothetical protein FB451DRAFT_1489816 [Mycena latifolia]
MPEGLKKCQAACIELESCTNQLYTSTVTLTQAAPKRQRLGRALAQGELVGEFHISTGTGGSKLALAVLFAYPICALRCQKTLTPEPTAASPAAGRGGEAEDSAGGGARGDEYWMSVGRRADRAAGPLSCNRRGSTLHIGRGRQLRLSKGRRFKAPQTDLEREMDPQRQPRCHPQLCALAVLPHAPRSETAVNSLLVVLAWLEDGVPWRKDTSCVDGWGVWGGPEMHKGSKPKPTPQADTTTPDLHVILKVPEGNASAQLPQAVNTQSWLTDPVGHMGMVIEPLAALS